MWADHLFDKIDGVVFDLDGTLYDQFFVRRRMAAEMLMHTLRNPKQWGELLIIVEYRRERERLAGVTEHIAPNQDVTAVARRLGLSTDAVISVVQEWMLDRPLKYLFAARKPHVENLFETLRQRGIKIGILSDYACAAKLSVLGLAPDATCHAAEVGYLKPHPAGLEEILARLKLTANRCLVIGDRADRDGECAAAVGAHFLLCKGSRFYSKLLIEFKSLSPSVRMTNGRESYV